MRTTHALFVCSRNKWRSPTAEQLFAGTPGIECSSAGLNHDAEHPLTADDVRQADIIFVMEPAHMRRLRARFGKDLARGTKLVCLNIPDKYTYMDPALVALLEEKVPRHLPQKDGHGASR